MNTDRLLSRRSALSGGLAVGAGLTLAACSTGSDSSTVAAGAAVPASTAESPSGASTGSAAVVPASAAPESSAAGGGSAAGGKVLAKLADIPIGSAISVTVDGAPVLLAQPKAGTVVGFKNACTHTGCPVAVAGTKLNCPCHGSVFDASTGAVLNGPAPSPLAKFAVAVSGQSVTAAKA